MTLFHHGVYLVLAGHIRRLPKDSDPEGLGLFDHFFNFLRDKIVDHHVGALLGKSQNGPPSDSFSRSRNQSDLSPQSQVHSSLPNPKESC